MEPLIYQQSKPANLPPYLTLLQMECDLHRRFHSEAALKDSAKQLTTCRSMCLRGAILFNIGAGLTILVGLFQGSKTTPDEAKISLEIFRRILFLGWWIVPICGVCSAFIGILIPFIDIVSGKITHMSSCDFASSLKCVVLFLGLNHLCARFFVEDRILTTVFPLLSVLFWYLFDSSLRGLLVDFFMAFLALLVEYSFLLHQTDYASHFVEQFQSARFWVPFIFFVGSVTTGHIGRQLASYELCRSADALSPTAAHQLLQSRRFLDVNQQNRIHLHAE